MLFQDIPGLEETKSTLLQSVQQGHVAHAQLFSGLPGNGHLPMALAFATYLNCTDKQEYGACGRCASCLKMSKLIHPDLHFVLPTATTAKVSKSKDAVSQAFMKEWREFLLENPYRTLPEWAQFFGAENKQCSISKEESRNIIRTLSLKAFEGEFKIMLIWLPELMHPSAANAILKVLEEPPPKTIFLLVSNQVDSLLTTILSRTQPVAVRRFTDAELVTSLEQKFGANTAHAQQVAYLAEGSMNRAFQLIAEVKDDSTVFFKDWMRLCFKNDFTSLIGLAEQFQRMTKENQKNLLQYALGVLRESLVYQFSGKALTRLPEAELSFVENFSKVLDSHKIETMTQHFNQTLRYLERNANPKIQFTNLSILLGQLFRKG